MKRIALFVLMLTGAMLQSRRRAASRLLSSNIPPVKRLHWHGVSTDASNNLTYACYCLLAINNTSESGELQPIRCQ